MRNPYSRKLRLSLLMSILFSSTFLITFVKPAQALGVPELAVTGVYWGTNPVMPMTVQPGDKSATLSIVITNTGDDFARNVTIRLELRPPFRYEFSSENSSKRSLQSITSSAGDIAPSRSFTFQFIVSIDSEIGEEVYQLPLTLTYRSPRELSETSKTVYVDIPIWKGELHVGSVTTIPPKVYPNSKQVSVRVSLVNTGRGAIKNLRVYLNLQAPFRASSTDSAQAFVGTVQPNQLSQAQFLIDISEDARPGNYPIEAKATIDGADETTAGVIGFVVLEKARFELLHVTPGLLHAGDSGVTLQVSVRNTGNVKAESVRVQLMAGNYFSGTLSDLLGTMNPGESRTAFFTIDVDGRAIAQQYNADLRLDWTQDEVSSLNDTLTLNMVVGGAVLSLPLVAIIVLVAAFLVFGYVRRVRRKRREEKHEG